MLLPSDTIQYLRFATRLVGVDENGVVIKEWGGLGTNFAWSTNATTVGGIVDFIYAPDDDTAPVLSGGVFDLEVDVIPEPPSIGLVALSVLAVATWRSCRSRNFRRFLARPKDSSPVPLLVRPAV